MKNQSERDQLYGNFWQIVDFSKKLVADFEAVSNDKELVKKLPNAEWGYIHAIIVNIGKIFSDSKNESFRLGQFKNICKKDIKNKIEKIESENKDIIEKIITNRDQIVAHLDKNFTNLCFSQAEINRMENDMEIGMRVSKEEAKNIFSKLPRSINKGGERYVPIDLKNDLPKIKELLKKMDEIWKEALLADHNKK